MENMTLNQSIFTFINQFAEKNNWLDFVMISVAEYIPYVFLLVLIFYWFYKRNKYQDTVLYAGYSALLGLFMNYIITLFYFHNRPFMDGLGNNMVHHAAENSFPSDHTTFMLSMSFSFLFFAKTRILGIVLSLIGIISGFSRVFVGAHYPFDILGSMLTAFLAAFLIFIFRQKFEFLNQIFFKIDNFLFRYINIVFS